MLSRWGKLGDLPGAIVPVIWVTTLRSTETILNADAVGGEEGVIRHRLQGGRLGLDLKIAYQKMKFLEKIITGLRAEMVLARRKADVSLFVDILKWG